MDDCSSLLPYEARRVIDTRIQNAAEASRARSARPAGRRRHRLAEQLRSVAERLDS